VTTRPTGTVTFLFTDVEGSTQLLRHLRDRYGAALAEHGRLLREAFRGHGGDEVDTQGDAFFYVFARARDAAAAAADGQRALAEHPWPDGMQFRVRIGLHTGEPDLSDDGRYHGMGVHRAARIRDAAHGGQILASQATASVLADDDVEGITLHDLGEHDLKDITRPERIYELRIDGLQMDFPPLRTTPAPAMQPPHRRPLVIGALAGVLAAAIAIPVFALGRGGAGGSSLSQLHPDSVGVVNPVTSRVVAHVPLGDHPTALAYGARAAWVALPAEASVTRLDANGRSVSTIPVGRPAAAHPTVEAASGGLVWVGLGPERRLQRLDTRYVGRLAGAPVRTEGTPLALAIGAGKLWVAEGVGVEQLDARSGARRGRTLAPELGATALAFAGGRLWVGGSFGVTAVDPQTGRVLTTVGLPGRVTTMTIGRGSVWLGFAPAAGGTGLRAQTGVARLDWSTSTVSATLAMTARPTSIAVAGGSVWVATADNTLVQINPDPANTTVRNRLHLAISPTALAAGGGRLWLAGV
jgi:class 3 adenylate cyclase